MCAHFSEVVAVEHLQECGLGSSLTAQQRKPGGETPAIRSVRGIDVMMGMDQRNNLTRQRIQQQNPRPLLLYGEALVTFPSMVNRWAVL